KQQYSELVHELEALKSQQESIASKLKISEQLIHSLSSESCRWKQTCAEFKEKMSSLGESTLVEIQKMKNDKKVEGSCRLSHYGLVPFLVSTNDQGKIIEMLKEAL